MQIQGRWQARDFELRLISPLLACAILALGACVTLTRQDAPPTKFAEAAPIGFPATIRQISADPRQTQSRTAAIQRLRKASPDGRLNILALSGGGAEGAFGAGALVGLTRRGERPQFEIVTGVSAGALIAPLAFLGPDWDRQLEDAFIGIPDDFLRSRGIGVLFQPGIYQGAPLVDLVDRLVTNDLIKAVAQQAASGRLLLVATTDLDKSESVIWNMGSIAAQGGEAARRLFRNVLVASASIPGVFPPVMIHVKDKTASYDEMHVDGGITVPFFVAPEPAFLRPLDATDLADTTIYVIVNGQADSLPETTSVNSVPIVVRSFFVTLKHLTRKEVGLTAQFAREHNIAFRFTDIPLDYPSEGSLDFRAVSMKALFNFGAKCAETGQLWTTIEQIIARGEQSIDSKTSAQRSTAVGQEAQCPGYSPTLLK